MGLILHEIPASPPVRAVKLCLAELDLTAEYKTVNLFEREQLSPDYIKINPQHTVPTLEDGDLIIWDSHAINAYLVSVYGKDDSLYPKDPKVRALVDQRLHFDTGVLFTAIRNIGSKIIFLNKKTILEEDKQKAQDALAFVEAFLDGKKFITGDSYNIADFSVYPAVTTIINFFPEELKKYPRVSKYLDLCKSSFKGIQNDNKAFEELKALIQKKLSE